MKKNVFILLTGLLVLVGLTAAMQDVPENITLKGDKQAAVQFPHKMHIDAGNTCKTCHHTLAEENGVPEQGCRDCHTNDHEVKPMKAFHGNCVDCHKTAKKEGKDVPVKCTECHVK